MTNLFAALAGALALAGAAAAQTPAAQTPARSSAYEPMAVFAPFDGRAFRAEWTDENGSFVDIATYDLILNGRALQSTHRLQGLDYGGRTIFFWDEAAGKYVYHYFTTGGFHTHGQADIAGGVMVTEEKVEGHDTIAAVKSRAIFTPEEIAVEVVYVGKDGGETPAPRRVYRPVADPGRLFPDTE
ncbi:MAG TPA: hypothetical protein DEA40_12135 [Parvularcula sp.]|nr:hypothetical protein [Parvularcula sp.]HBS36470.1 hypothetical protein [Parvularcula sp.]